MNAIQIVKVAVDLLNGKKLNTGTVMILAVAVLKFSGVPESEATQIASGIMLGVGGVMTLWGYIDRWVKSEKADKAKKTEIKQ